MRSTVIALTLAAALGQAPAKLIELDVVAVNRQGAPVTDLKPADVEVWLEQYRLPLESMTVLSNEDPRRRRTIVLLLDDITIPPELVPRARNVASRFIEALEPGDQMTLATLTGGGTGSTGDRAVLRQALGRFGLRANPPLRVDELAAHVLNTYTAISRQVAELPGHRRTIVGIGSGFVFDTPVPPVSVGRNLRGEWTTALRAMAFSNAALYVIDPGGVGTARAAVGTAGMASETGGFAFMNTNDLDGAVDRIMAEAVSYYILRVADPPFFRSAPLRKVDVRTTRRDVTLRARELIPGHPEDTRKSPR